MSSEELLQRVEITAEAAARRAAQRDPKVRFLESDEISLINEHNQAINNAGGPTNHHVVAARSRGSLKASRQQSL